MKNILLVLTGGTIGSVNNNGIIGTQKTGCRILEMTEKYLSDFHFDVKQPLNILSENIDVRHWEKLLNFIYSQDISEYDGIIITHGSDTLSYSSAMLGIMLNGLKIPVAITAADKVPDDPESNAVFNFCSCAFLLAQRKGGVYTVYKNSGESEADIYVPTRLIEADRLFDRFSSFDGSPVAKIDRMGNINVINEELFSSMEDKSFQMNISKIHFGKTVMLIHPYPLVDYSAIIKSMGRDTGAVLHVTYHSATVSENAAVLADECNKRGIPLYLCSFKKENDSVYESSDNILKKGTLPLYNISSESAFAKLLTGINLFPENIDDFMRDDIYFEKCIRKQDNPLLHQAD